MRKLYLAGTMLAALAIATPALSQSFLGKRGAETTQALTVDSRGVLTMAPLLEKVTPAVVSIETSSKARKSSSTSSPSSRQQELLERFFGDTPGFSVPESNQPRSSIGSGVIVDARKGYIITNHHVIDGADEIYVKLEDRRELEAELGESWRLYHRHWQPLWAWPHSDARHRQCKGP